MSVYYKLSAECVDTGMTMYLEQFTVCNNMLMDAFWCYDEKKSCYIIADHIDCILYGISILNKYENIKMIRYE
jgi:hypothetical protein